MTASSNRRGSTFERDTCRQLSLWWSLGERDDWLWRASQSGGRATQRAKKGLQTANAAGDLAAQCAEGQKLLDCITWELKRGYKNISIADVWEKPSGGFHDFIKQARDSAVLASTQYFAVLHKRDRRDPVLYIGNTRSGSFTVQAWDEFLTPQSRDYWYNVWTHTMYTKV